MSRSDLLPVLLLSLGLAPGARGETLTTAAPGLIVTPGDLVPMITIDLRVSGAVETQILVKRPVDTANFCSASAAPASADQTGDHPQTTPPLYHVVFGRPGPGEPLERPGPSLALTLSQWRPPNQPGWTQDHEDPAHDAVDLVIEDRHFVGRGGLTAPVPHMLFAWRDDGRGGGFLFKDLHEVDGDGTLNVEGTWSCPPVDATAPDVTAASRRAATATVPAAPPYRLRRIGTEWWATGPNGESLSVDPDLNRLRLAPKLLDAAEHGQLVLMVQGEIHGGVPPRLVVRHLQGIVPAPREDGTP